MYFSSFCLKFSVFFIVNIIIICYTGGRVCIVTRVVSAVDKDDDYGMNLLTLMEDFIQNGKWKRLEWKLLPKYNAAYEGCLIVYEVC